MSNLPARMRPDQVEALAHQHLARYDGGTEYPAAYDGGYTYYDGADDANLYFGGGDSFAVRSEERIFSGTWTNALTTDETIYILGGLTQPTQGTTTDGTFKSVANNNVSFAAGNSSVPFEWLRQYVKQAPLEVGMIRIQSSNEIQVVQKIVVLEQEPWDNNKPNRTFSITKGQDQNVQQKTILFMRTPGLVLGFNTLITYKLLAGATVTLEFHFGAAKDPVQYMNKAIKAAAPHVAKTIHGGR